MSDDRDDNTYVCDVDGSCIPNPGGRMGQGVVIRKGNQKAEYRFRQKADAGNSNNVSEYLAVILCLRKFQCRSDCKIVVLSDSRLVVNQMQGLEYIGRGKYVEYARECEALMESLRDNNDVKIKWIPREENWEADKLSND